jgi:hypothetical protein
MDLKNLEFFNGTNAKKMCDAYDIKAQMNPIIIAFFVYFFLA